MSLIVPVLKDDTLVREIYSYADDEKHFHIWWLGQSGFLLMYRGVKMLLDPYLSDTLTEKYAGTGKPHERISERVIDPKSLHDISVVTSSHNHTDHLDAATLRPIIINNPNINLIIPEANREFVCERLQCKPSFPTGINDGQTIRAGIFKITGVPAKHNEIEKDKKGQCKFLGYIIQFANYTVYHSGDTLLYKGMEKILQPYKIDLALLPINGDDPARDVAGNMNGQQAVDLAKAIDAKMVIPCHYDMFAFNTADPQMFAEIATDKSQPHCILPLGGHFSSEKI